MLALSCHWALEPSNGCTFSDLVPRQVQTTQPFCNFSHGPLLGQVRVGNHSLRTPQCAQVNVQQDSPSAGMLVRGPEQQSMGTPFPWCRSAPVNTSEACCLMYVQNNRASCSKAAHSWAHTHGKAHIHTAFSKCRALATAAGAQDSSTARPCIGSRPGSSRTHFSCLWMQQLSLSPRSKQQPPCRIHAHMHSQA